MSVYTVTEKVEVGKRCCDLSEQEHSKVRADELVLSFSDRTSRHM